MCMWYYPTTLYSYIQLAINIVPHHLCSLSVKVMLTGNKHHTLSGTHLSHSSTIRHAERDVKLYPTNL